MQKKSTSISGSVTTLCISPVNGSRLPCEALQAKQSIIGDCQNEEGWTSVAAAKIKNDGALLGEENIFIESLLAAVSIGDEDIVREVIQGATAPRIEKVWATGDNVYVSGLDMSWSNFHIGDLLVLPEAVIVNSGYPHSACWKYAVRAGDEPKAYINSPDGNALRMRGIKGSFLYPSSSSLSAAVRKQDPVRIVRRGTPEYAQVLQDCRTPLEDQTDLIFRTNGEVIRAAANDTNAYVDLLVRAGIESARIDTNKYKRTLPQIAMKALGIPYSGMEISEAAKSGDGTIENVGIKTDGGFQCPDCRQKFDSEIAKGLHWKFIHDPNRHQED